MGRDSWRYAAHERERLKKKRMNPAWRGVGCFMMVLITLAGYLVAGWLLRANAAQRWIYLPPELINPSWATFLRGGVLIQLVTALLFMIFSFGLINIIYSIMFPIQPGDTDVPPLKRQGSRRRR
jgi:thiosulfate reductase cytochrome b subunit